MSFCGKGFVVYQYFCYRRGIAKVLTNDVVQEILSLSGVPEEVTTKIEKSYIENFGDTPPVAEILIDNKALAAKAQKKKEELLEKQVKILESKLETLQKRLEAIARIGT